MTDDFGLTTRLRLHEETLKTIFPRRLVGELNLSESKFREILADLRQLQTLYNPPKLFPRTVMVAMVFTARYDYKGAFWKALYENLSVHEVHQRSWGDYFRYCLNYFDLFSPPEHWMVNVFPVLFHSIIPEASRDDFAIMVRSLAESIDVEDLDDEALLELVRSYDLPGALRAFINGKESAEVACDLIRQVYNDFRQNIAASSDLDLGTIRGRLLASVLDATPAALKRFRLKGYQLAWRWDLSSGELGTWLSGAPSFDDIPLRLRLAGKSYDLESYQHRDGSWMLGSRVILLPPSAAGSKAELEFGSGASAPVMIGSLEDPPLFFKTAGSYGSFTKAINLEAGVYAIAASDNLTVLRSNEPCKAIEDLLLPSISGIRHAKLYELNEGDIVRSGSKQHVVRGRTRPNVAILRTSLWTMTDTNWSDVSVYSSAPAIRFESPLTLSTAVIVDRSTRVVQTQQTFNDILIMKPDLQQGQITRASVIIDGKQSGSNFVDFVVLPLHLDRSSLRAGVLSVTGSGTLTIGTHILQLSNEPKAIRSDIFMAQEWITYSSGASEHQLRYVGERPVMWRLDAGAWSSVPLACDFSDIANGAELQLRSSPGSALTLLVEGSEAQFIVGFDGRVDVQLSRLLRSVAGSDLVRIDLRTMATATRVMNVAAAPVAKYWDVKGRYQLDNTVIVGGEVALDRAVDAMRLTAQPYQKPWESEIEYACVGEGRYWTVNAALNNGVYLLNLVCDFDDRSARVLDSDRVWTEIVGEDLDQRSDLDARLYKALSGDEAALEVLGSSRRTRVFAMRCCTQLLISASTRYHVPAGRVISLVGRAMDSSELPAMEELLLEHSEDDLIRSLALLGLPLAAAPTLPWNKPIASQIRTVNDMTDWPFYNWLLGVAKVRDRANQAAEAIDDFADDNTERPLRRAYAELLRLLRADEMLSVIDRIARLIEHPDVMQSCKVARNIIGESSISASPLLEAISGESLFAECTISIWLLALASRLAPRRDKIAELLPSVVISRWAYDRHLSALTLLALRQCEAYVIAFEGA